MPGEYTIAGGLADAQRLARQAHVMASESSAFLSRIGLASGWACLDVGCGDGQVTLAMARAAGPSGRAVGVDMDAEALAIPREAAMRAGVRAEFLQADAVCPIETEAFDLAYARLLLSHLIDPSAAVRAMRAEVRPGGVVAVEDIFLGTLRSDPPEPALDRLQEIYGGAGRLLGDPVRDAVEHLEAVRASHVLLYPARRRLADERVARAPDIECGGGDRVPSPRRSHRPVPVERRGQRTGRGEALDVGLDPLDRKPVVEPAQPALLEQLALRGARRAKQLEVLGALPLVGIAAERLAERRAVRSGNRAQGPQPLGMRGGGHPGHRRAPVVADEVEAWPAERVGDRHHVADQLLGHVGLDLRRADAGRVAALVDGDRAVPRRGEHRELMLPLLGGFGEAVQQEDGASVHGAGGERVERPDGRRDR